MREWIRRVRGKLAIHEENYVVEGKSLVSNVSKSPSGALMWNSYNKLHQKTTRQSRSIRVQNNTGTVDENNIFNTVSKEIVTFVTSITDKPQRSLIFARSKLDLFKNVSIRVARESGSNRTERVVDRIITRVGKGCKP